MTVPASRAQIEYLRAQYGDQRCFFSEYYLTAPVADINYAVPAKRIFVPAGSAGDLVVRMLGDTADTTISAGTADLDLRDVSIVKITGTSTTAYKFTVFW